MSKKYKYKFEKRIYFSISSEGLGHSSRALAIIREFKPEEVIIGSYDYAYERFKNTGYPCELLHRELKLIGNQGAFDVGRTIIKNHAWALTFNQLVRQEIDIIKKYGASCVVADGRLVPVMAADKLGIPCVVITNQSAFYPFFEKDSALVKVFGKSFDWIMKTWLSSAEEIMIPDFAPPNTICLPNLSTKAKVMKRTRFVGPLVQWDRDEITAIEKPVNDKPYIVVTLGGHTYRKPLFDNVLELAKIMPNVHFDIFTSFETDQIIDNIRVINGETKLAPYLKAADLVITQAGHSTAMELVTLGIPSVIVPDYKQNEQENNAERMKELGVSTLITYSELSPETLRHNIDMMLNDDSYRKKAVALSDLADETKGRKKAAEVLRDYFMRLHYY
ncbi:MAG: glycosyltransferase [bacterium]